MHTYILTCTHVSEYPYVYTRYHKVNSPRSNQQPLVRPQYPGVRVCMYAPVHAKLKHPPPSIHISVYGYELSLSFQARIFKTKDNVSTI